MIAVHDIVDLRSNTLALPTPAMREAMARAGVGDDVWDEGQTVRRLEEQAARQTNIVIFHVDRPRGAGEVVSGSPARKAKAHQIGPASVRCVTHKDVDADDIERPLEAFRQITAWPPRTIS